MISSFASINIIKITDSFVFFSLKSSLLCRSNTPFIEKKPRNSFLDNFSSLSHLHFFSFNVLITHFFFTHLLSQEIPQIKFRFIKSLKNLRNVFASKSFNLSIVWFHHSFSMNWLTSLCLILAIIYWFYRLIRTICNLQAFYTIRNFYHQALEIQSVGFVLIER